MALDDLAETIDKKNHDLKKEQADLLQENSNLKSEILRLQAREEKDQCKLELFASKTGILKAEIMKVIKAFLVNVEFLRDSADVITKELRDYQTVLQTIHSQVENKTDSSVAKTVGSANGWTELHYHTGQKDDGRVYFKRVQNEWFVLVSFKGSQEKDLKYLKKN